MANSLKSLINRAAGILRRGDRLEVALRSIETWCGYSLARRLDGPAGWELQNMMTLGALITAAALRRTESRGAHAREDFPARDDVAWRGRQEFRIGREPVFDPLPPATISIDGSSE
jgi:L-aspartate oxidase